ncbi:WD40 repeat-like protein [Panus rudis PR-1116 ss-1]|nr:WD40 repeat-like protein [Panus rudis PR-1116 ss-1]
MDSALNSTPSDRLPEAPDHDNGARPFPPRVNRPAPGRGLTLNTLDIGKDKQKDILRLLLSALQELDEENSGRKDESTVVNHSHNDSTVEERLQQLGAEKFKKFHGHALKLDHELKNFGIAARQIGSSVGVLISCTHLRDRLIEVLVLFRENAASLYPRKVIRKPAAEDSLREWLYYGRVRAPPGDNYSGPRLALGAEEIPATLQSFAKNWRMFLDYLNEFPEFKDEDLTEAISSLEKDLKYWASSLKQYKGRLSTPEVRSYLDEISVELGDHLRTVDSFLAIFIETGKTTSINSQNYAMLTCTVTGLPTIRIAQKHSAANFFNLSTVATLFSGVTAQTLQNSADSHSTLLENAVNAFWFTSLVLSIGVAVNSLLGLTWKRAMYRSPSHRVPWWVLVWFEWSPLVFLVFSFVCFTIGLVIYSYSSGQHPVTSILTATLSACSCFGLAVISLWFLLERWTFKRHQGTKLVSDVFSDIESLVHQRFDGTLDKLRRSVNVISIWTRKGSRRAHGIVMDLSEEITDWFQTQEASSDPQHSLIPIAYTPETRVLHPIQEEPQPGGPIITVVAGASEVSIPGTNNTESTSNPNASVLAARQKFIKILKNAQIRPSPRRLTMNRIATTVPKLRRLAVVQDVEIHTKLIRHMQFSPDGRFLATASWDNTCLIMRVQGNLLIPHRTIPHNKALGFVGQVAWSPDGKLLLTRTRMAIVVWKERDGSMVQEIRRPKEVQSVVWFPDGDGFLAVENGKVFALNLQGEMQAKHRFEQLTVHDISITRDGQRLLCIGTLRATKDELYPTKRPERQILMYNLAKHEIEYRVPTLYEVSKISITQNDRLALVSYDGKTPAQLWHIDANSVDGTPRLALKQTYIPASPVELDGPSYFGGAADQLVLRAGINGDIHIWDRDSAAPLHHLLAQWQILQTNLTSIAWNRAASNNVFMLATGTHDGFVRLWTTTGTNSNDHDPPGNIAMENTPIDYPQSPADLGPSAMFP